MIGRPMVFILPSRGTVCPESRSQGPGKVMAHTGGVVKKEKKEQIKQRLDGVNTGSAKRTRGYERGVARLIVCWRGIYIVNL